MIPAVPAGSSTPVSPGAFLIGKANPDQSGAGLAGTGPPNGVARNPFDPAMARGGSSSGSAVTVASGPDMLQPHVSAWVCSAQMGLFGLDVL